MSLLKYRSLFIVNGSMGRLCANLLPTSKVGIICLFSHKLYYKNPNLLSEILKYLVTVKVKAFLCGAMQVCV